MQHMLQEQSVFLTAVNTVTEKYVASRICLSVRVSRSFIGLKYKIVLVRVLPPRLALMRLCDKKTKAKATSKNTACSDKVQVGTNLNAKATPRTHL